METSGHNRLGFRGHRNLPTHLLETADFYGLAISNQGKDRFLVSAADPAFNFSKFIPDTVTPLSGGAFGAQVFSLGDLKTFLSFLHQPARASLDHVSNPQYKQLSASQRQAIQHEERMLAHRMLRFIATGSVEIVPDRYEHLEEGDDVHFNTERAMRDADAFATTQEFGAEKISQSAVPGTGFKPDTGFSLRVSDGFKEQEHAGDARGELYQSIENLLREFNITLPAQDIVFDATTFSDFIRSIQDNSTQFSMLIDRVEFIEDVEKHIEQINERQRALNTSLAFNNLHNGDSQKSHDRTHAVLKATSALSPVIDSEVLQDMWTRYHYSARHEDPVASIQKDFAIFAEVIKHYSSTSTTSAAQAEAIAQEFRGLISFSGALSQTLSDAYEKTPKTDASGYSDHFASLASVFDSAAMSSGLNKDLMNERHRDILNALEKHLGLHGASMMDYAQHPLLSLKKSTLADVVKTGVMAPVRYATELATFVKESPGKMLVFAAIAGFLVYMNYGDQGMTINSVFREAGSVTIAPDGSLIPTFVEKSQQGNFTSWHYDLNFVKWGLNFLKGSISEPVGLYKHIMNSYFVEGLSNGIMEKLSFNADSVFSKTAKPVISWWAEKFFGINLVQNFSHAAFWSWITSKGYNFGFRGWRSVSKLFSPLTDIAARLSGKAFDRAGLGKYTNVSERLYAIAQGNNAGKIFDFIDSHIGSELEKSLYSLSVLKEIALSYDFKPVELSLKTNDLSIGGSKADLKISQENFPLIIQSLDRMELIITHALDGTHLDRPWYKNFLSEKLFNVRTAIENYVSGQQPGLFSQTLKSYDIDSEEALLQASLDENLRDLAGAELLFTGKSRIFSAFSEQDSSLHERNLGSTAKSKFNAMARAEFIESNKFIKNAKDALTLGQYSKTFAKIAGMQAWGSISQGARYGHELARMFTKKSVVAPLLVGAATCVGLDMAGINAPVIDAISAGTSAMLSTAAATGTFMVYNFWEDILLVHVASGTILLTGGALTGYAMRGGIKPVVFAANEQLYSKAGIDLKQSWENVGQTRNSLASSLLKGISNYDHKIGGWIKNANRDEAVNAEKIYEPG